jgi:seryl-tRNA synthetase
MIDLKDLRDRPDVYRAGAERKHVNVDIDAILALDSDRRAAQLEFERLRAEQNRASAEIARTGDAEARRVAIARMGELKAQVKAAQERTREHEARLRPLLLTIPQPPDDDVPVGRDASDNVVLRVEGALRAFDFQPLSHVELAARHRLVDFERGVRLSGSRSYVLIGAGALMHNAVLQMALDLMVREKGFTPLTVPVLVREEAMLGTGFFPAGRDQAYDVDPGPDQRFLTGTSEVALTAYHAGEILDEADLPRRYTAISTCFRREAGTYGKDTAGLYRVHQFDKCEQVVICRNDIDESRRQQLEMLGFGEELLRRLELPYRVIDCCTGDLGNKNAAQMDLETWMPSRVTGGDVDSGYAETHSASRLYEYQARRLDLRYRDAAGAVRFCHTLNSTVAACPRILIPLWENHQNRDGSITIPAALRPDMQGMDRIG